MLTILGMPSLPTIPPNAYASMTKTFQRVKPNTRSFNIFLKAIREYSKSDLVDDVSTLHLCYKLLQRMKDIGVAPDAVTINTIIDIAVGEGALEKAEEVRLILSTIP